MKRLISIFLFIGITLLLLNCSEKNPIIPDLQDTDQVANELAKVNTKFSGTCTPTDPPNAGDNAWYDDTDDPRVTGVSVWITELVNSLNDVTTKLSGTAELTVDNNLGKWEMEWRGTMTLTSPDGTSFRIVAHADGTGTEGDVLGLKAKWKYTMEYDGTVESYQYLIKGMISE